MKEYVISIGAVIIITTISTLILPNGKIGRFIKGIFSIIIILVLLNPITNFSFELPTINASNNDITYQEGFLDYVNKNKIKNLEIDSEKILNNIGIKNAKVTIYHVVNEDYSYSIKNVKINLEKAVIISDGQHIIIIEEGVNLVSKYLSVDKEGIIVDGYNQVDI